MSNVKANNNKRHSKRQFLDIIHYDKKRYSIPMSKEQYWFRGSRGQSHCVVGCYNISDCYYISDKGLVSHCYCLAHAEVRILDTMITGNISRGIWCAIYNGRLQPHEYYFRFMKMLMQSNPRQAKKLQIKLALWKKSLSHIRGKKLI